MFYNQSKCSFCNADHVKNHEGLVSHKYNAWFCSGACMSLYQHDNKIVHYSPGVVQVLEDMRKKHYTKDIKRRY